MMRWGDSTKVAFIVENGIHIVNKDGTQLVDGKSIGCSPSCVEWIFDSTDQPTVSSEAVGGKLLVGSDKGDVVICDLVLGPADFRRKKVAETGITSMAVSSDSSTAYIGLRNGDVLELNIADYNVKRKWKPCSDPITALSVDPSGEYLVSANQNIYVSRLHTSGKEAQRLTTVKTFSGHARPVTGLKLVRMGGEGSLVVSWAEDDQLVHVWNLKEDGNDFVRKAAAMLGTSDFPLHCDVATLGENDGLLASVCTKAGKLDVFEAHINGRGKRLKPMCSRFFSTRGNHPKMIQIHASKITSQKATVVYGDMFNLRFDTVNYHEKSETCVFKDDYAKQATNGPLGRVETTVADRKHAQYLTPDHLVPRTSKTADSGKAEKTQVTQISLDERLKELIVQPGCSKEASEKSDPSALAMLLVEGLHSGDNEIVAGVLLDAQPNVVRSTLRQLPLSCIVPLLKEIVRRIHTKTNCMPYVHWLNALLRLHISFLSTHPSVVDLLSQIYQLVDSRVKLLDNIMKLHGKVDFILSEVEAGDMQDIYSGQEAKINIDEDSSDAEEIEVDMDDTYWDAAGLSSSSDSASEEDEDSGQPRKRRRVEDSDEDDESVDDDS